MLYDPNWAPPQTEIKLEPWRQVLLDAADLIENQGWTRFRRQRGEAHCAIGAIAQVSAGHPHDEALVTREAARHLMIEVNRNRFFKREVITFWNDTRLPFIGKYIVMWTMRRAAKRKD